MITLFNQFKENKKQQNKKQQNKKQQILPIEITCLGKEENKITFVEFLNEMSNKDKDLFYIDKKEYK